MRFITSVFAFIALLIYAEGTRAQSSQTVILSTPGAQSWTAPCGVTSITVHVYGGGGGGGGSNTNSIGGGGGGAGGYASWTWNNIIPGTSYPLQVGAGGAAGLPGWDGTNGQMTWFQNGAFTIFATGGTKGLGENNGGTGGTGGSGAGWAINANGTNGQNGTTFTGGLGGSIFGNGPNGGSGGPGGPIGAPGANGNNYGGGGGGGGPKSGSYNPPGGAGAPGAVVIQYTLPYNYPEAGPNFSACNAATMNGNNPSAGWVGEWVIVSYTDIVPPVISNIYDPNASVTILNQGNCCTLGWQFTSATCTDTMIDYVNICFPTLCNDDPCGAEPLPVNTGPCSYTTYTNAGATNSTGMVEPGCGNYTDNDSWFSAVVPANGVVTFQVTDAAGGLAMTMAMAIYQGTNCFNLEHAGCDDAASAVTFGQMTYIGVPGETVWIRVWETAAQEEFFNMCAFTNPVSTGNVISGMNTLTCGTSMSFVDPGGPWNYQNNAGATYVVCPSVPGQYVSVDFSTGTFNLTTNSADYLTILDGNTDSSVLIAQYSGNVNPGVITSSHPDGCLTFIFQSDNAGVAAGWNATITCSAVPGVNDTLCSPTNCTGECGQWICEDGLYPTTNDGNAAEDLAINTSGCFTSTGEIASKWFYFTALTAGSIEFTFNGPNGQDYNLAIWGPSTNGIPPCPQNTNEPPIRCSMADAQNTGNPVGLSQALGNGEAYEGTEGDGWIDALYVTPGETYAMILNIYQNGNPQPVIDLTIGGSGTLDCLPVYLPVTLISFEGMNQGSTNLLFWSTNSELDNDFFTVERSVNGYEWEVVGTVDGAGTSDQKHFYQLRDENPFFPVTYYRLKQTDFNGVFKYFDVISINAEITTNDEMISSLFPNPTDSYVTFTYGGYDNETPLQVQVINQMGAIVVENQYMTFNGMPSTLRVDDLAKGVYQMVFTQGDRRVVKKLSIIK